MSTPRPRPGRALRPALYGVGLLLLVAAVAAVMRDTAGLDRLRSAAAAAPSWLPAAIAALPLTSWLITSLVFWLLTRPLGRVGPGEMASLIGSAWLLNVLPLKPGLVARIAYHRAIGGIPVWASVLVVLAAAATGAVGIILTVLGALALDPAVRHAVPPGRLALAGTLLAAAGAGVLTIAHRRRLGLGRPAAIPVGPLAAAVVLRVLDTLLWALRYWLAFRLVGTPRPYGVCVVVAGVSQFAGQLPVSLGVREWAVGVTTALVGTGAGDPAGTAAGAALQGLTADVVTRLAEVLCFLPVGLASYAWLSARLRRAAHDPDPTAPSEPPHGPAV